MAGYFISWGFLAGFIMMSIVLAVKYGNVVYVSWLLDRECIR